MMSIYVNNNFLVGHEEALDDTIDQLESPFNIKIETEEIDYLGFEFLVLEDSKKSWLGQPNVIKSLSKKYVHQTEKS